MSNVDTDREVTKEEIKLLEDKIEGKRIRRLEIAEKAEMQYSTLSQYLRGYLKLSYKKYEMLCEIVDNF